MTRVRVEGPAAPGERLTLDPGQGHHLARVLRKGVGDAVELVDGQGVRFAARLVATEPVALEVGEPLGAAPANPVEPLEIWLPLLKGGRSDDLVRQLVELGATRIVPYVSERTVARPDAKRASRQRERWQSIAIEATRQCGRSDEPSVQDVAGLPDEGPGVFLWEGGGRPARQVLYNAARPLRVLVGPEGGLAQAEADRLVAQGWEAAWLGPRVLRAETAVIAAAVLALSALGDGGY